LLNTNSELIQEN